MEWASAWGKRWGRKRQPASIRIRVLSATELGGTRYGDCLASGLWPVEVRFRDGEERLARPSAFVSRGGGGGGSGGHGEGKAVVTIADTVTPAPPIRGSATEWWIVYALVPAGPVTFTMVDDDTVVTSGTFDIAIPAQKSKRQDTPQSGATVEKDRVAFRFADPESAVQTVHVESPFFRQPVAMARDRDAGGKVFVGYAKMPPGTFTFRFRVVLKETTRPESAPFTELGWDPSEGFARCLFTWHHTVNVKAVEGGSSDNLKDTPLTRGPDPDLVAEKVKAEAAARRRAEEAAKRKAEEAAKRKAEEAAKREAEEAAKRKAEEAARQKAEEAAKRKAARRKAEEAAKRKAEEAARRKAEEAAKRKAEEAARRKAEEAAKRKAEEAAKREAEEASKREAEEAARRKGEEAARQKAKEAAKRKAEETARRKAEEAAKRKAEEAAKRKSEEAARLKAEERQKKSHARSLISNEKFAIVAVACLAVLVGFLRITGSGGGGSGEANSGVQNSDGGAMESASARDDYVQHARGQSY